MTEYKLIAINNIKGCLNLLLFTKDFHYLLETLLLSEDN